MADNDIIFVLKIYLSDGSIIKMGTKDLSVGSDAFDGDIMTKFSLSEVSKLIDIQNGGKFGGNVSLTFSIPRNNSDSLTSGYINSFYPSTGQPILDIASVHLGWGYTGISAIVWEHELFVDAISYTYDNMAITCYETTDLELVELPYYKVTNIWDEDSEVFGEYPYMEEGNNGVPIPIIYGYFGGKYSIDNSLNKDLSGAVPIILTNQSVGQFVISSHDIGGTLMPNYSEIFVYLDGHNTYQHLTVIDNRSTRTKIDGVNTNEDGISMTQLIVEDAEGFVIGELNLPLNNTKFDTKYKVRNVLNPNPSVYDKVTIDDDPIYLSLNTSLDSSIVGECYKDVADTHIYLGFSNWGVGSITLNSYLVSSGDVNPYTTSNDTAYRVSQTITDDNAINDIQVPCYNWRLTGGGTDSTTHLMSPSDVFRYTLYIQYTGSTGEVNRLHNAYLHMAYMDINIRTYKGYLKSYLPKYLLQYSLGQ